MACFSILLVHSPAQRPFPQQSGVSHRGEIFWTCFDLNLSTIPTFLYSSPLHCLLCDKYMQSSFPDDGQNIQAGSGEDFFIFFIF